MREEAAMIRCAAIAAGALALWAAALPAEAQNLTLWSHWADQKAKVEFVESAARAFEQKNPGVKIQVTWYQKNPLYAALKTALRAGQGPDIFYAEPDQVEYMENGLVLDLKDKLDWGNIEPWAREVWTWKNGVYGFPLEAWTVELYYDKKRMADLGIQVPETGAFNATQFLDVVKKAKAANVTPLSQGVGDRPYPGAFITHEALLKKLGVQDYVKLLKGEGVKWDDPRVRDALTFVKKVIDAGAFPSSFSTLKLGEAHAYFHTRPGALMFQMGSFYPSRAFLPPDQGGQPKGFQLGIMNSPVPDGAACPQCKTIAVGGSFSVNAASKNAEVAAKFLNFMATPEMGNKWLEGNLVQTGIKTDPGKISGETAAYFRDLSAVNKGAAYAFGIPDQNMQAQPREVFRQVINQAFPAGLLSVDEVIAQMKAAY
jgi:multiple sugar transport system substrate-binding protein